MNRLTAIFRLAIVLLGPIGICNTAYADVKTQDDLARQSSQASAFIEAMNTRDADKLNAFVQANFSERVRNSSSLPDFVKALVGIASTNAPFTVGEILVNKPNRIIVSLKNREGLDQEIKVDFEPDPPHGVSSVLIGALGKYSSPPPKQYTNWQNLRELADEVIADTKSPALGLAVFHDGENQLVVAGVRRVGSTEAAATTDRWLIGSMTKSMTSMMIARLVDTGVLRWNMTVSDALPDVPIRPEYKSVTIIELLHHRSGLPQDLIVDGDFVDKAAGDLLERAQIRDHYARFTLARDPIAKPDETMAYSNAGYALAGHIAEVVTHKPYEQLMEELVFHPLGMSSAKFGVPGSPGNPGAEGQLMGHTLDGDKVTPHLLDDAKLSAMEAPAGLGVSMTIDDLMKFARYQLDGLKGNVQLMSKENFDTMHLDVHRKTGEQGYACGWVVGGEGQNSYQSHTGSDGTFWGEVAIWPQRNLVIVAISNAAPKREPTPPHRALHAIFDRFSK